ncbi:MAG TPA: preprotein translocase subunit SecA [Candidatus Scatomorpha intestinigallinarum]|uniref:Protein translocase subunit SecA n=1 Tax=Candidatus Scatomorpha intestinigallinarum TaxID=2840923 RepID=A0A9D1DMI6_9FIRM|nr:preprotein translocase subunit SecA [Candidatus Scatomorpha intestinigallinarum]
MGFLQKLFGSHSDHELKRIYPIADKIEALEPQMQALSDEELRAKTDEFKARYQAGEDLDKLLPEAFAVVREAAWRVLGMKPFRVQLIGGIVLHQGRIAEMKTGEGKTLVAVLPAYLNALAGEGVHIVTVNDYLAKRDSEWMGKVHRFLGLSVGLIVHGLTADQRRAAYAADITYGTNNEMGFDYLRDNMAIYKQQMVQRGHAFAIVDEVDSILIDEARTPLIISGQGDESTDLYRKADDLVRTMKKVVVASVDEKQEEDENLDADYVVDEKARTATLTARGTAKAERFFNLENLSDLENSTLAHHINQALKAHGVMKRDIDYVVKDGEVIIVDEFTGRLMLGRRYSEGLHQAIEAKEHVDVQRENKTLATITFQNYFRLYGKLSGMTGTALTEEEEFTAIYELDIIEIPTNKPVIRKDWPDVVYKNEAGKDRAIIEQIIACHEKGQPVLVGTISIEKSEYLSSLLKKRGIPHNVLNAKQHEREAEIVAQAGKLGAVTIATNMAGRGTDIMLGGNAEYLAKTDLRKAGFEEDVIAEATGYAETDDEEILKARAMFAERLAAHKQVTDAEAEKVRAVGGLFILGTERHESRRIDNQLRGRAGRQGDPGESRFYIAMTDDIMRLFGSERVMGMMETLGMDEDTPLDQKMLSGAIEQAQKTVESRNFQTRKNVLEYDDVMNVQRNVIYDERRKVLDGEDLQSSIRKMIEEFVSSTVADGLGAEKSPDLTAVNEALAPFGKLFLRPGDIRLAPEELSGLTAQKLADMVLEKALAFYDAKEKELGLMPNGQPVMRELERVVMLRVVDEYWMEHLDAMTDLRQGIGLRGYGNTKPIDAYKNEGFEMFEAMIRGIREETVRRLFVVRIRKEEKLERKSVSRNAAANVGGDAPQKKQPVKKIKKPGRNDPCPCGKLRPNGLPMKYKDCCGRNE